MLSLPTLWVVSLMNFMAVSLVWVHVTRSYPNFTPARFLSAACLAIAVGAIFGLLRPVIDVRISLIGGSIMVALACCLMTMGIFKFHGRAISWRFPAIICGLTLAGLIFFLLVIDSMATRIVVFSLSQAVPIAMTLPVLLTREGHRNPGARMTGVVAILMLIAYAIRAGAAILGVGGELSIVHFNDVQAALVVTLVFLAMTWNFGFLLMAIDRLRSEVENLALLDDLTGIANRRHLLQRMTEQCDVSVRTGQTFAVLAIDLDGFKAINDSHGHAAGDDCLRRFARAAQSRLRPGDLLARTGGDEFCVVLPATTLREGAMIARHIVEESRAISDAGKGDGIAIAASIGVAQWTQEIGTQPERLLAVADVALYNAKKLGKDRYAIYEPGPESPPVTEPPTMPSLRRIA